MNESYINRRINQILVHSYLYEKCNVNIIEDSTWDKWAKELVSLIHKYPDIAKKSPYYRKRRKPQSFRAGDIRCEN